MAKEVTKEKRLKRLDNQLKSHSQNSRMVKRLESRITTAQNSK